MSFSNKMRIAIERRIARIVVRDAIKAGFALSVDNGGDEYELENSASEKAVMGAMFLCDEDRLYFVKDGKPVGWVYFVYGNEGPDVICDYTLNLEPHLARASKLADRVSS